MCFFFLFFSFLVRLSLIWAVSEPNLGKAGGGPGKGGKNHSDQMKPQIVLEGLLPQQNQMEQKCYLPRSHSCSSRHGKWRWRFSERKTNAVTDSCVLGVFAVSCQQCSEMRANENLPGFKTTTHSITLQLAKTNTVIVTRINKMKKNTDDDELTRGTNCILRHGVRILDFSS